MLALEMIFRFSPDSVVPSLLIMLKGMLGIFLVIVVIWIFVAILNRVTRPKDAEK